MRRVPSAERDRMVRRLEEASFFGGQHTPRGGFLLSRNRMVG